MPAIQSAKYAPAPKPGRAVLPCEKGRVEEVRLGGALLGVRVHRPSAGRHRLKLSPLQGRAANRLKCIAALGAWRAEHGVLSEAAGMLRVIVDALAVLDSIGSWRADEDTISTYLPALDRESVSEAMLRAALTRPRRPDRLLSDAEAGRLLGLVAIERDAMQERGLVLTLHPRDETAAARALRRAERQRVNSAKRAAEYRKRKRLQRAIGVTSESVTSGAKVTLPVTLHINSKERDAPSVTFRVGSGSAAVAAAVAAGAAAAPEIAKATGLTTNAVKVALHRLVKSGAIHRFGRGRYAPAEAAEGRRAAQPLIPGVGGAGAQPLLSAPKALMRDSQEGAGRGRAAPRTPLPSPVGAAAPRGGGAKPRSEIIIFSQETNPMRAPEIERKIVAEVNRHGAIPRGRARALSGLSTPAADEMLEALVEGDVILDIGEGWLAAPVPPVPAPGARPAERTRPVDPRERMIERLALQALWDGRASVWRIARDHDDVPGVSAFAVRCSLRFAIEDGLVEWLGGDDYQLTPRGLRVIAQGELQH